MENSLLDLILLSEKRKNVLLLLLEGPKDIETIKKALKASATSVQPQVKKLKEQHLIVQEKDLYTLSEIGRIIADKMKPLVDTLFVLEENPDYWADRDMSQIPTSLLRRINELGHAVTIEPKIDHMFEMIPEYVENVKKSNNLDIILPYFHPLFPSFFLEIAEKKVPISIILPEAVFKRWVEDFREQTEKFMSLDNTRLLVCKDCERIPALVAADNFMTMALFPKNGVFDRKYVMSFEASALVWGKELYNYYEGLSAELKEIEK